MIAAEQLQKTYEKENKGLETWLEKDPRKRKRGHSLRGLMCKRAKAVAGEKQGIFTE